MLRALISLYITVFIFTFSVSAQTITGDWFGQLDIPNGKTLRINFHISKNNETYITSMDSPDQGAYDIPTDSTSFIKNKLNIKLSALKAEYNGELKDSTIIGTFTQNGYSFLLNLSRQKIKNKLPKAKPQEPKEPFNYSSEAIYFTNPKANNIKLAGTLTLPKNTKNPEVVILISGSGPQNRNEEVFNHKPFLVLADYLTNNGIAVLRYDDRGIAESEGDFKSATTFDFALDVEAAIAYLKTRNDIDTSKIGLIGHSEGGLIAPIVASKNKNVAFIVLLAGPGVNGATILETQSRRAQELAGVPQETLDDNEKLSHIIYAIIKNNKDDGIIKTKIEKELNDFKTNHPNSKIAAAISPKMIEEQMSILKSKWLLNFIRTEPKDYLEKTTCPVLALNGSKDFQVLPKINLEGIKNALEKAGNKDVTIKELEGLNHLFQTAKTGSLNEYNEIEETFSPTALKIIKDWILKYSK
ncbi:alpha/beta hydrolase family protein [Yeosuana marina]|uniref:alpha/beta hydrolase family protein n=1 Tax=Yeosuana marina TaxID=1565536 RepID=UPI0030ED0DD4|tara:strand:- start:2046 stop:3455 length:1410 start_codon:yes stop_codon:yes gene_type:complete